jgi:ABC-2 type transport system permease protein
MRRRFRDSYLLAQFALNLRTGFARTWFALSMAAAMCLNNLTFFLVWVIYFSQFSGLAGWQSQDVALLIGIIAWAYGLLVVAGDGVRQLARSVADGRLDIYLGRPRHPLPGLILSRSTPSGLGDMASALLFWFWLGERSPAELPYLLCLSTAAAFVFGAITVVGQSLAFWWPRAVRFCEEIFEMMVMVSFFPQHVFGWMARLALFTVFPVAFASLLPVEAVREADPWKALAVVAAAAFYSTLAVAVFNRGLKRYESGNRMIEIR